MKQQLQSLLYDLKLYPFSVILVPAPEQRFEGHMIRVCECSGPDWLIWLRDNECERVKRIYIKKAIESMIQGKYRKSRYIKLIEKILNNEHLLDKYLA